MPGADGSAATGVEVQVLPSGPVWFAAGSTDGDCHHGPLGADGIVSGACGAHFQPIRSPLTGRVAWWHQPVDATHGCPQCLYLRGQRQDSSAKDA